MHKNTGNQGAGDDHKKEVLSRAGILAGELEALCPGPDGKESGECLTSLIERLADMGLEDSATELLDAFDRSSESLSPDERFVRINGATRMATQMIEKFGDGKPQDCKLIVKGEIIKLDRKPGARSSGRRSSHRGFKPLL